MDKKHHDQIWNCAVDVNIDSTVLRKALEDKDIKAIRRLVRHIAENAEMMAHALRSAEVDDEVNTILSIKDEQRVVKMLKQAIQLNPNLVFHLAVNEWCKNHVHLLKKEMKPNG